MKMVVGLGNPGKKYSQTRHNFGFMIMDRFADLEGLRFVKSKLEADLCFFDSNSSKVVLVKPMTFMNLSGEAVLKVSNYYKISPDKILLVYDDLDLNFGEIKTTGTSSAGHKGVESIFQSLGTNQISRIRLGLKNNTKLPAEEFVLQKFTSVENGLIDQIVEDSIKKIHLWLD